MSDQLAKYELNICNDTLVIYSRFTPQTWLSSEIWQTWMKAILGKHCSMRPLSIPCISLVADEISFVAPQIRQFYWQVADIWGSICFLIFVDEISLAGSEIPGVPTMYLTLRLNFEAVTNLMSGILSFPVSPDLYNSFDTLLILLSWPDE